MDTRGLTALHCKAQWTNLKRAAINQGTREQQNTEESMLEIIRLLAVRELQVTLQWTASIQ